MFLPFSIMLIYIHCTEPWHLCVLHCVLYSRRPLTQHTKKVSWYSIQKLWEKSTLILDTDTLRKKYLDTRCRYFCVTFFYIFWQDYELWPLREILHSILQTPKDFEALLLFCAVASVLCYNSKLRYQIADSSSWISFDTSSSKRFWSLLLFCVITQK